MVRTRTNRACSRSCNLLARTPARISYWDLVSTWQRFDVFPNLDDDRNGGCHACLVPSSKNLSCRCGGMRIHVLLASMRSENLLASGLLNFSRWILVCTHNFHHFHDTPPGLYIHRSSSHTDVLLSTGRGTFSLVSRCDVCAHWFRHHTPCYIYSTKSIVKPDNGGFPPTSQMQVSTGKPVM